AALSPDLEQFPYQRPRGPARGFPGVERLLYRPAARRRIALRPRAGGRPCRDPDQAFAHRREARPAIGELGLRRNRRAYPPAGTAARPLRATLPRRSAGRLNTRPNRQARRISWHWNLQARLLRSTTKRSKRPPRKSAARWPPCGLSSMSRAAAVF